MENTLGILGALMILAGWWHAKGHRRELLFAFGGACLLLYSVFIQNDIFTVVMALFTVLALVHLHQHKHKGR